MGGGGCLVLARARGWLGGGRQGRRQRGGQGGATALQQRRDPRQWGPTRRTRSRQSVPRQCCQGGGRHTGHGGRELSVGEGAAGAAHVEPGRHRARVPGGGSDGGRGFSQPSGTQVGAYDEDEFGRVGGGLKRVCGEVGAQSR